MQLLSFQQMLSEYGIVQLEIDDQKARAEMLVVYPHSVLVEGGFMEFDNLDKWIENNIGLDSINWLIYGKTGYDFGIAEYFFTDKQHTEKVSEAVPLIYTIYPHSYPPNHTARSIGYEKEIIYDPKDKNAIVYSHEEKKT